ncbi:hypothetical protein F9278_23150 [Streptomyces phaeolivaceus]|uniref:Uncharacterized protein n=1 Tax=Streptomyces phaeolivaceus TaxID=2653200 RepID=A0A5P8K703_9ACTN|nr:hypothetical protein [Streptomyces phaeolivaceus]QFQ98578.1 hypothetical protein F9278_23150 [Streptomyces phaeolivaceus]
MQPTARPETVALPPVEPEPAVLVHSSADRRLATEHWLLATHPTPEQARREWSEPGKVALLPLGTLFSAVRLPGRLVLAVAGGKAPSRDVDALLDEVLEGGPVICDVQGPRYYALVPGSTPEKFRQALEEWRPLGVDCLGRGTYLGVPRVDAVEFDPQACASYWSVPMSSAATLCTPLNVARLIAAGKRVLEEAADES